MLSWSWLLSGAAWLVALVSKEEAAPSIFVPFFDIHVEDAFTYPEFASLQDRPNVGVCFSGGGSRSFEASLGYLKALHDADLLSQIRYISAVSGGSWATAAVSYHDPAHVALGELLGRYTPPEQLSWAKLARQVPLKAARFYPVRRNLLSELAKELAGLQTSLEDVWVKAIHRTFLHPAGISFRALPAWTQAHADGLLARNPELLNTLEFRVVGKGMPFPVLNTAMLGPVNAAPFGMFSRKYTMMEATPLYVGFPRKQNLSYVNPEGGAQIHIATGGVVDPAGFGSELTSDLCGLKACPHTSMPEIPLPLRPFSIANATAASSWAPGGMIAEQSVLKPLENVLLASPYFSPFFGGRTSDVFLGDGENVENQGVITLLQRGAESVIMFVNSPVPLSGRAEYNPYLRLPKLDVDVDSSFANLFGFQPLFPPAGEDYAHDQVFRKRDLSQVVAGLQDSAARGLGAVCETDLVTVENRWWGVQGGRRVHLVVVYLGRVGGWEAKLPAKTADLIAPHRATAFNPKALPTKGAFAQFPHISTAALHLNAPMANALADMSAWVVKENIQIFLDAIRRPAQV